LTCSQPPSNLWKSNRSRRHIGLSHLTLAQFPCRRRFLSGARSFLPAGTGLRRFISAFSPPGRRGAAAGSSMCFLLNHHGRRLSLFPTIPMTQCALSPRLRRPDAPGTGMLVDLIRWGFPPHLFNQTGRERT
jgi:hypothetical protein